MAGGAVLPSSGPRIDALLLRRGVLWLVVRRRRGSSYDPVAHESRCPARLTLPVWPIDERRIAGRALWTGHGIHVGLLLALVPRVRLLLPLVLLLLLLLEEPVRSIAVAIRARRCLTGSIETGRRCSNRRRSWCRCRGSRRRRLLLVLLFAEEGHDARW